MQNETSPRRSWPYFRTPIGAFIVVMLPINGLMAFLLVVGSTPLWMRVTSALVILISLFNLARGYYRRLVLEDECATLILLFGRISISWDEAKAFGVYSPGGGGAEYAFVTRHGRDPQGVWEIDEDTIQIQNREGLLAAIQASRKKASLKRSIERNESG